MRPPRAPTASSCWRGAGAPSPLDPRSRGWLIRRRLSLPIPGRNRLLEIEHISVRIGELAEPLAPFHLFGRHGKLDAHLLHPLVVRKDVVLEERDPGWTRFRLVHLADVHPGPRLYNLAYHSMTSWSEMRSTCSSTASSFSDSHKSTIRRAAGSPWNSVTMSCHFRRRALNAATISGPSKTTYQ